MRNTPTDPRRSDDRFDALLYAGSGVFLFALLGVALWMNSFQRLDQIEFYIIAIILVVPLCGLYAYAAWRRSKRIARPFVQRTAAPAPAPAQPKKPAGPPAASWSKKVLEER